MNYKTCLDTLLRNTFLWRLALVISIAGILFLATTSQPYPIPSAANDKFNHILAFIELTLVSRLAWPAMRPAPLALMLLGYGFAIELVQDQLSYRHFSLADLLADSIGIAIGLLPWPGVRAHKPPRTSSPSTD